MAARFLTPEENEADNAERERARQVPAIVAARTAIQALQERVRQATAELEREARRTAEHLVEEGHNSDIVAEVTGLSRGYVATMAYNLVEARKTAASDPLAKILRGQ